MRKMMKYFDIDIITAIERKKKVKESINDELTMIPEWYVSELSTSRFHLPPFSLSPVSFSRSSENLRSQKGQGRFTALEEVFG